MLNMLSICGIERAGPWLSAQKGGPVTWRRVRRGAVEDWSTSGLRQGSLGPRFGTFLAWVAWHRAVETPLIIHENVAAFDPQVLVTHLGDLYYVTWYLTGPEDVGWACCRRPRLYAALFHKRKLRVRPGATY